MAKDTKAQAAAPAAAAAPAPAAGGKKKLIIIIVAVLVLALAGGGAAWFFLGRGGGKEGEKAAVTKPEKPKPAIFVALETFTVNLQPENGDHFLQTTLSLKITDPAAEQVIKQQMPEIRSRLLLLLSSKKPSELGSVEGKQGLAEQIASEVNKVVNPAPAAKAAPKKEGGKAEAPDKGDKASGPVVSVLYTNFIIQ